MWFDVGAMALISAANPPLDAARLDIMPAGLWGRAESTRTFIRSVTQALAPLVFGGLARHRYPIDVATAAASRQGNAPRLDKNASSS